MADSTKDDNTGCAALILLIVVAIGYGLYRLFVPTAPVPAAPTVSPARPSDNSQLTTKKLWPAMVMKNMITRKGHAADFVVYTSWLPSENGNGKGSLRYQVDVFDFTSSAPSKSAYLTALAEHCNISLLLLDKDNFIVSKERLAFLQTKDEETNTLESLEANSSDPMSESNYRLVDDINFEWICR